MKKKHSLKKFSYICLFLLVVTLNPDNRSRDLSKSLDLSGKNKNELIEVLDYYKYRRDTIGYKSAVFLIKNMKGHYSNGSQNSLYDMDLESIKSSYLISTINHSLEYSKLDIISHDLPQNIFNEYILPYRLGNEKLLPWKQMCSRKYINIIDSMRLLNTFGKRNIYAIQSINHQLIGSFKYNNSSKPANILNWKELMDNKSGDCWTMVNSITYPLRALGVPIANDYIISWGNSNGRMHSWNTLINSNNSLTPFLGFESSPPDYNPFKIYGTLRRYPAKIFRKTFADMPILPYQIIEENDIPSNLRAINGFDVTDQYLQTKNIIVNINKNLNIIYLSTFSDGKWIPSYLAYKTNNEDFIFNKMATGILYLPFFYLKGKDFIPLSYPFVIENNKFKIYKPNFINRTKITIKTTQSLESDALNLFGLNISNDIFQRRMEDLMNGFKRSIPINGMKYYLYYWDKQWKLAGVHTKINNQDLIFENVPSNSIYRVVSQNSNGKERVFTYNSDQLWR